MKRDRDTQDQQGVEEEEEIDGILKKDHTVTLALSSPPTTSTANLEREDSWRKSFLMRASSEFVPSGPVPTPSSVVRLFLIRHGQSAANVDKTVLHSLADHVIPLSPQGKEQAVSVAQFLKGQLSPNARMWMSPYRRARETAKALQDVCSFSIVRESIFLGEQQFGLFEGLELSEIAERFPLENQHFEKCIAHGGRFYARMPLGESRFDVACRAIRVAELLTAEVAERGGGDVVIVAHGTTLRALAMAWLDRTPEWFENQRNPTNCSVRLIEGRTDKGYVFAGFQEPTPRRADKEQDLAEYASVSNVQEEQPSSPSSASVDVEERIRLLEEELRNLKALLVSNKNSQVKE